MYIVAEILVCCVNTRLHVWECLVKAFIGLACLLMLVKLTPSKINQGPPTAHSLCDLCVGFW